MVAIEHGVGRNCNEQLQREETVTGLYEGSPKSQRYAFDISVVGGNFVVIENE